MARNPTTFRVVSGPCSETSTNGLSRGTHQLNDEHIWTLNSAFRQIEFLSIFYTRVSNCDNPIEYTRAAISRHFHFGKLGHQRRLQVGDFSVYFSRSTARAKLHSSTKSPFNIFPPVILVSSAVFHPEKRYALAYCTKRGCRTGCKDRQKTAMAKKVGLMVLYDGKEWTQSSRVLAHISQRRRWHALFFPQGR